MLSLSLAEESGIRLRKNRPDHLEKNYYYLQKLAVEWKGDFNNDCLQDTRVHIVCKRFFLDSKYI